MLPINKRGGLRERTCCHLRGNQGLLALGCADPQSFAAYVVFCKLGSSSQFFLVKIPTYQVSAKHSSIFLSELQLSVTFLATSQNSPATSISGCLNFPVVLITSCCRIFSCINLHLLPLSCVNLQLIPHTQLKHTLAVARAFNSPFLVSNAAQCCLSKRVQ